MAAFEAVGNMRARRAVAAVAVAAAAVAAVAAALAAAVVGANEVMPADMAKVVGAPVVRAAAVEVRARVCPRLAPARFKLLGLGSHLGACPPHPDGGVFLCRRFRLLFCRGEEH